MNHVAITIPTDQIVAFCRRWKIRELALFGSVLRDDFGPDSDIDLLATFADDARWSLFNHMRMEEELEAMLHRKVDLISKDALEQSHNWIRRKAILDTAQVFFPEREAIRDAR